MELIESLPSESFTYSEGSAKCRLHKDLRSSSAVTGITSGVRCYALSDTQPEILPSGFLFSKCSNGICEPVTATTTTKAPPTTSSSVSDSAGSEACMSYWNDVNLKDDSSDVRTKVASLSACVRTCFANPECNAFSFRKGKFCIQKQNVLKSRDVSSDLDIVSGLLCNLKTENGPQRLADGFQFSTCKDQNNCGTNDEKNEAMIHRLNYLRITGEQCLENLILANGQPGGKTNVRRKLFRMDKLARKFYNQNNFFLEDLEIESWDEVKERVFIWDTTPIPCLIDVGLGYKGFFDEFVNSIGASSKKTVSNVANKMTEILTSGKYQ